MFGLGQRPGLAHQRGYRSTDGEIEPFDEGGLNEAGEANGFEFVGQGFALTPEHAGDGVGQLAAAFSFDQLTIEELFINLPVIGASSGRTEPGAEMSSDGGLDRRRSKRASHRRETRAPNRVSARA